MQPSPPPVQVAARADGTLTYLVNHPPDALPPVRSRDVAAAWDAAGDAARSAIWGAARLFRFRGPDGTVTDLALADRDACTWAGAVEDTVGMGSSYGLSLCLRLLALVDLLANTPSMAGWLARTRGRAEPHPAVLRAAAIEPLTIEARFDESGFRARLATFAPSFTPPTFTPPTFTPLAAPGAPA